MKIDARYPITVTMQVKVNWNLSETVAALMSWADGEFEIDELPFRMSQQAIQDALRSVAESRGSKAFECGYEDGDLDPDILREWALQVLGRAYAPLELSEQWRRERTEAIEALRKRDLWRVAHENPEEGRS